MNLTDLHQALRAIADEVDDDPRTRLASVDRRVETTRRSKRAGIVVTTCAVLATLVLLPNWGVVPRSDSPSAGRPPYGSLATVDEGGLLIYRDAAGVRLLGSHVGHEGARTVAAWVTPRTGDLGWTQPCAADGGSGLQYHLSVNGKDVPSAVLESLRLTGAATLSRPNTTCDATRSPMQAERSLSVSPRGNVAAWHRLGIVPGSPARFVLSVTAADDRAGRAALAAARPALAIFERPGDRLQDHGVWVDRHLVDPRAAKGAFRLVRRQFVTLGPGTTPLTVPVPRQDEQVYVRTFVKNGERSGATLTAGAPTADELSVSVTPWSVEKLVDSGPSRVRGAVAVVPDGARDNPVVGILVYVRQS